MTLEEIEMELPWGFHDAFLESAEVDWVGRKIRLVLRVMMDERQTVDRRARVVVSGIEYVSMDPPAARWEGNDGLWINAGSGHAPNRTGDFPPTPAGAFVHWLFVDAWNSFIHICGREAALEWLDPAPVPVRRGTGFALPGDEIDVEKRS